MNHPFTYVYLNSVEHSGSTLIACLLGAHPEISSVGEFGTHFSREGTCSCGARYGDCGFWRNWVQRAREEGIDFEIGKPGIDLRPTPNDGRWGDLYYHLFPWRPLDRLRDLLFGPFSTLSRQAAEAVRKSERLAGLMCEMDGTRVFFDSTKNPLQIRFLARYATVPLKLICLVRDGRGVMNSLMEKERYTPEQAVSAWLWGNRNMERSRRYLPPDRVLFLRLEDLCTDFEGTLDALFRFADVDRGVRPDYRDKHDLHIVGNRMRHTFAGEIRYDESWRQRLSPVHLDLFAARAGALNRAYGYGV